MSDHAIADVAPCNTASAACEAIFQVNLDSLIQLYRNYDLTVPNPTVENVVIIIHGVGRNFGGSFQEMNSLVQQGSLSPSTLIVAPHFLAPEDKPSTGFLYWNKYGWAAGDNSLDTTQTSSYTAIDQLVIQIAGSGNFPNLKKITITGMSAGGQTTQRYAAGNQAEGIFQNIHFRYLVVSPSSYMYLNADRWVTGTQYQFSIPQDPACNYNDYRYGTQNLNSYMSKKSANELQSDFLSRDVNYAVGDQDDATAKPATPIPHDPKDAADLDVSCQAEYQGNSRLQRSEIFNAYLNSEFPQNTHTWVVIPGVAHQNIIFNSPQVSNLLAQ